MSTEEKKIETPRGAIVQVGKASARLEWKPGFAPEKNARYDDAQKFVDSEVLRLCDKYIPMRTGMLKKSGTLGTVIGKGEVKWIAPYSRVRYYRPGKNGSAAGPFRGPKWFERMKADHGKEILAGAKKRAGGK